MKGLKFLISVIILIVIIAGAVMLVKENGAKRGKCIYNRIR